jgi:dTDP-4-dehydrorhamnose reductase
LEDILRCRPDFVVNCTGLKKADSTERLNEVNSHLPEVCARLLPPSVRLIHASSDAVFVPSKPRRTDLDLPDAEDPYGLSKRTAEAALKSDRCFVIRCSVIGPELATSRNLLSWFLSERTAVAGYMNHWWNGITTLEWASLCLQMIRGANWGSPTILQPGIWPPTTKYDLLCLVGKVWRHCASVRPAESCDPIYRTLVPNVDSPALQDQLTLLQEWY